MTYKVLVTGIGTIIGYGEIHSLRKSDYDVEIFGMDMNPECIGRFWCDHFIVAKAAKEDDFPEFLVKVVEDHDIDLVLLGTEQEMHRVNGARDALKPIWNKIAINADSVFRITEDKWETYRFLKANELPTIESVIDADYREIVEALGSPFLVKPRKSYSSRGIAHVHNEPEYEYCRKKLGAMLMAQRIVGDTEHEYTAATFGFGDGTCTRSIVMKRKLSFEGATLNAEVVDIPEIEHQMNCMAALLRPLGPTNFQYRKDGGQYYLLEINPRISSSTSIRMAFGYNESEMCIDFFVNGKRGFSPVIRKGKAYRYIEDYIEYL